MARKVKTNEKSKDPKEIKSQVEAEPLYKRALEILEKVLGTNHPNTEVVRYNLKILHEKNSTIGTGG